MGDNAAFDPAKYLTKLHGGDYLEVKWRLLWLRTEHPDAHLVTELVKHDERIAIFKAQVTIPDGGSATGWGSESPADFHDYMEKAETKAVGRALAALGYGTQFTKDFEFGAVEAGRVVDTPVTLAADRSGFDDRSFVGRSATEKQLKAIYAIARNSLHLSDSELEDKTQELFGCTPEELSRADASRLIDSLKSDGVSH